MAQDLTPRPQAVILRPREAALTPSLPQELQRVIASGAISVPIPTEAGGGIVLRERLDWPMPQIDRHLQDIARSAREAILEHLEPMEEGMLAIAVARLLSHRWRFQRTAAVGDLMQEALLIDWTDDLSEFPEWAFTVAARQWRRTQDEAPTIAGIRRLCEEAVADDRRSLRLIDRLLRAQRREAA